MRRILLVLWLFPAACGGPAGAGAGENSPAKVIQIPASPPSPSASEETPPERGETPPPSEGDDPLPYFVGRWDGVVNDKLKTELIVDSSGGFHVHLPPQPHRPSCDLGGKLRIDERLLHLDVETSTCEAEPPGSSLERKIISKREHEFTVQSPDTQMTIRYTRQRPR